MIKHKIKEAYDVIAYNYNDRIDHKPHNAYYDRPNTMALVGEVNNKLVLDAACGPGKYAEILMKQGANVIGFDISPEMIKCAKGRNERKGHFFTHDLSKPFEMLMDDSFDVVLCALAMHYVENWDITIQEFHRVLKPSGKLVISIEHPFFEYEYFKAENYFAVEPVKCTWNGFGIPVEIHSFRRPLSACIMPLINNGFSIDEIVEPKPVKAFEDLDPKHYKELMNFPAFMCIKAISNK